MNIFSIFYILIEQPIINILVAFYHLLVYVHIPYALGFAIVSLTVFIRLITYPLTIKQLKTQKKTQELAPHLSKLKEKHKGDTKAYSAAQMALYNEHGVNPMGGCLPTLVQIVILFFGLYPALKKVIEVNPKETVQVINNLAYFPFLKLTHVWDTYFFGLELAKTPSHLISTVGPLILLVPILTGLLQFIQQKMLAVAPYVGSRGKLVTKEMLGMNKDKKTSQDDFMATFQKQSAYLFPVMIGFFSWQFSIGLSLYWNTFALFGIIQQYRDGGMGGLSSLFVKKDNN